MADNINVNNSLEQLSFEDMPIDEEDYVPINNVQLAKSLYEYAKHVQQNDIEKFYDDFKELITKYVIGDDDMKLKTENAVRARIRKLLFESNDWDDNRSWDPADIAADEQEEYQKEIIKQAQQDDQYKLKSIAKELGKTEQGVHRDIRVGLNKLRFIIDDLTAQEFKDIKLTAAKDYIKYIEKSAKTNKVGLDQEEIDLLKNNVEIVMTLDGYRDFLRKYILAAARKKDIKL